MILEMVNEWGDIRSVGVKDRQPIERVRPLLTGDLAPFFSLIHTVGQWKASIFPADVPGRSLRLPELLAQGPLVVSFYCPCWGSYAQPFLNTLIKLAGDVTAQGGRLVVFSNEDPAFLARQTDLAELVAVHDTNDNVARQFGVYSETDPIWDRVSGISEEVYIPALYIVDRFRQIRYHFLDENFEGFHQSADLLNTLTIL